MTDEERVADEAAADRSIRCRLDEDDYVAGELLNRRKSEQARRALRTGAFVLVGMAAWFAWYGQAGGFTLAMCALVGGVIQQVGQRHFTRWKVRQSFRRQPDARRSFDLSWDEAGLYAVDETGRYHQPWAEVRRWREDDRLFLLNLSDRAFLMVPKRAFAGASATEAFRSELRGRVAAG